MWSKTGKLSAVNAPGAAGAHLAVAVARALEAPEAVRQRRAPQVGEPVLDGAGRVGVDGERRADGQRRRAALHALAVGLEVDAPRLVGDERAVVGAQRRVGVDVQHGRGRAVGGHELRGVELRLALLQVPVGPHRLVRGDRAVGLVDVEPVGQVEHRPQLRHPRPDGDHDLLDGDVAGARVHDGHGARAVALEAGDLDALDDLGARRARLVGQPEHRLPVEREAAAVLVQADGQALGAPVGVEPAHVRGDGGLAGDQLGVVADPPVALVHLDEVGLLRRGPERDVAGAVVVERLRVGLPDLHARGHQLRHRRLEVVVAHHAAGDPGGAGGHRRSCRPRARARPSAPGARRSRGRARPRRRRGRGPRKGAALMCCLSRNGVAGHGLYTNSFTAARLAADFPGTRSDQWRATATWRSIR